MFPFSTLTTKTEFELQNICNLKLISLSYKTNNNKLAIINSKSIMETEISLNFL